MRWWFSTALAKGRIFLYLIRPSGYVNRNSEKCVYFNSVRLSTLSSPEIVSALPLSHPHTGAGESSESRSQKRAKDFNALTNRWRPWRILAAHETLYHLRATLMHQVVHGSSSLGWFDIHNATPRVRSIVVGSFDLHCRDYIPTSNWERRQEVQHRPSSHLLPYAGEHRDSRKPAWDNKMHF